MHMDKSNHKNQETPQEIIENEAAPRPADIYGVEHLVRMLCTLRRNIVCFSTIMIVILSSWLLSFSPLNFFSFFPSFLHIFYNFLIFFVIFARYVAKSTVSVSNGK